MYNAGDFDTTETVNIPINSFSSDDPSASVTITDLAAGDIEIHKDGSIVQRASDSGVTVSINFDGVTGNHMIHIDLSDNTDSGFYANGSRYLVRVEGVTIDGGTVNAWVGGFSIGCVLRPSTAGNKLDVASSGEAGLDFDNIKDATGAHTLTNITVPTVTSVGTCTTNTDMRGTDNAATEAKQDIIDGIVNDILIDTGTTIPSQISGLENVSSADVTAACTSSLNTYDPPTKTEMDSGHSLLATVAKQDIIDTIVDAILTDTGTTIPAQISALNNLSSANVISACTSSLNTYDPPTKAEMDSGHSLLATVAKQDIIDNVVDAILVDTGTTIPSQIAGLKNFDPATDKVIVTSNEDKTGYTLSDAGIDSIFDEITESTLTFRQLLSLLVAVLANKSTGGGTSTLRFRDYADTKNRITATVDENQNRLTITVDLT